AEWVAVDRFRGSYRDDNIAPQRFERAIADLLASGRFETVFDEDNVMVLRLRRSYRPSKEGAGGGTMGSPTSNAMVLRLRAGSSEAAGTP
ncbi:MAG TPA: hypothetical protein VFQ28_04345, partial [Gaiella sp.]|nr:hypothetical protein [Gaiella sp.]